MRTEPGLRFWLDYVRHEGGAVEEGPDEALVLLPAALATDLDLGEEVTVTADPEVAAEDGAQLLIAGHPALDRAAERLLGEGDVAWAHLPWPRSRPPAASDLLARARERVGVDHGRIDPEGSPTPVSCPVVRMGALVTYTGLDQYQEVEEVWVDGRTGRPLPAEVRRVVAALPPVAQADAGHPAIEADLATAVRGADDLLEERAGERGRELAAEAEPELRAEAERVGAYYSAALKSIERRTAAAAEDRRALLEAQAEATRAERARRLQEIDDKRQVRHHIRPVRLHVILVPAMHLPAWVRRGERTYPLSLMWLLPAADFGEILCPHCGAAAPLVAGRDRLGCRECLAPPVRPAPAPPPPRAPEERPAPAAPAEERPAPAPAKPARPAPTPPASPPRMRLPDARERRLIERAARDLPREFWSTVFRAAPWPVAQVERGSPLAVAFDLWGPVAPALLLGIGPWMDTVRLRTGTVLCGPELEHATTGYLEQQDWPGAEEQRRHFTLRWRLTAGVPVLAEVLPYEAPGVRLPAPRRGGWRAGLAARPPAPRRALDELSRLLWSVHGATAPLAFRLLAARRRLPDTPFAQLRPAAVAAAISATVAPASGMNITPQQAAAAFRAEPADVAAALLEVAEPLAGVGLRGW